MDITNVYETLIEAIVTFIIIIPMIKGVYGYAFRSTPSFQGKQEEKFIEKIENKEYIKKLRTDGDTLIETFQMLFSFILWTFEVIIIYFCNYAMLSFIEAGRIIGNFSNISNISNVVIGETFNFLNYGVFPIIFFITAMYLIKNGKKHIDRIKEMCYEKDKDVKKNIKERTKGIIQEIAGFIGVLGIEFIGIVVVASLAF